MDASRVREEEADLSTLDDEEISRETRREVVRRSREDRRAKGEASRQRQREASMEIWERIVLLTLLAVSVLTASSVVVVGLLSGDDDLGRLGLPALCALGGGMLYRLRSLGSRWRGR